MEYNDQDNKEYILEGLQGCRRVMSIEHRVTLEELQNLNALFQVGIDQSIEQIEQLFMKIDYEAVGRIQWDGFCTYLQLRYSEQADALAQQNKVSFQLPAELQGLSYGGPMQRILSMPNDTFIMIREDGAIYFWSLQLKLKRRKRVFDKSTTGKPRWVTDVISMPQYNKLVIGTGNREIQLYELSNLEPYCQIGGLEAIPLKLDYSYEDPDKCLILYGDDQGCVNILVLASVGELLRTWNKLPKVENMPNISVRDAMTSPNVNYIRWKVHGDWVTQLNYYDAIKVIISSSNHEPTALVIECTRGTINVTQTMKETRDVGKDVKSRKGQAFLGLPQRRAECDRTVFRIYKGVKAFSFCKRKNLLLTGGMDRIIRVWNPYLPRKPIGMLKSHTAHVIYIHVSAEDSKTFSMSTDNTIKENGVFKNGCPLNKQSSGSPPEPHQAVSHREPVVCCRYNPAFRQVVSCSEASVVKVWNFETGRLLSEFIGANGEARITCLIFDSSGRRCIIAVGWDRRINVYFNHGHKEDILCVAQCPPALLATSSYDGEIIIWNVISGHMCCKLNTPSSPEDTEDRAGPDRSVSCLAFLKTRAAKFESAAASLIANGPQVLRQSPDRQDHSDSRRHHRLLADQKGFVHVYDIKRYGLPAPEMQPPENVTFWRAHVSLVTSLELIEDKYLCRPHCAPVEHGRRVHRSSTGWQDLCGGGRPNVSGHSKETNPMDWSERLYPSQHVLISLAEAGTFGQSSPWDIFTPDSWSHPRAPYEILTDPQSMPAHPMLEGDAPTTHTGDDEQDNRVQGKAGAKPEKTSHLCSPDGFSLEAETKENISRWSWLELSRPPGRAPELVRPTIYQTLRCHDIACTSACGEKPDLSILGSDLFD